jgi:hypothetical protein
VQLVEPNVEPDLDAAEDGGLDVVEGDFDADDGVGNHPAILRCSLSAAQFHGRSGTFGEPGLRVQVVGLCRHDPRGHHGGTVRHQRSELAKSHNFCPSANPPWARSAIFLERQIRPSSRQRVSRFHVGAAPLTAASSSTAGVSARSPATCVVISSKSSTIATSADRPSADEFFALARAPPTPFMRSYYQRVAERYLSSKGDLRAVERPGVSSTQASMS